MKQTPTALLSSLIDAISVAIEALLFSSSEPLSIQEMYTVLHGEYKVSFSQVEEALKAMSKKYHNEERGFELIDLGDKRYMLRTKKEYATLISYLHSGKKKERLSHSALETIACIAFLQPTTRIEIDAIRGVDSSGVITNLLERGLIEIAGKKEAPGRPSLYRTTDRFLTYFGIKSLDELKTRMLVSH